MGESIGAYRFWWGSPKEGGHTEELGVDGMTLLKLILEE
jgi:hypothetical protein